VSLALVADAWSRSYRSRAVTFTRAADARQTRNGIRILPDEVAANWPEDKVLPSIVEGRPANALDETLHEITAKYRMRTADVVALQLEYLRAEKN
jgi:hypothetical protein